ncbi:MAG TPA: sigma-54 factor interaction domain-containing protein [Polyangiales bacterium]|nr:sigma-54 factor interaction domain-containing protein [Polyangiales bacterium]
MSRLYELAANAARTTIPVLIVGETGSGKESVARAVHEGSSRASAPFKALNCAALPVTLIASTLFGHERGSFTGADRQSSGLFEQAGGGTLFLDEVAELSPEAQAALLRVLETGTFTRVGGTREIRADVRLVAATHRDLSGMVTAGSFRADLLYRLDALRDPLIFCGRIGNFA